MKCPSCGAEIPQGTHVCEFCGSAVDLPLPAVASPASADVFTRVERSSQYQQRNSAARLAELPKIGALEVAIPVVFFGIFIAASAFMTVMFAAMMPFAAIVPGGFVAIGVLLMIKVLGKARQVSSAEVLSRPAIVAAKRTSVSGGTRDSSASTSYYVTFEFADGRRSEYTVKSDLYSQLSERDAGILFTRSDWAQAFDRVAL